MKLLCLTLPLIVLASTTEMGAAQWALWYGLAFLGIAGSALFSGLETGIYTLNRVKLHVRAHQPQQNTAKIMKKMLDKPGTLIGTLLIGNNLTNYVATLAIAVILGSYGLQDTQAMLVNTLILTPLLLIFGEVLPKDTFGNYTDKITYPFARFLRLFQYLLIATLLLPIVNFASYLIGLMLGKSSLNDKLLQPRGQMMQLVREGVGQGVISDHQSRLIQRVLNPPERNVADAMIPWSRVAHVRQGMSRDAFLKLADEVPYSRFPVAHQGKVTGMITIYAALHAIEDDRLDFEELQTEIKSFTPNTPIRQALKELQHAKMRCGVVIRQGKPVGFFTLKDLVEPYLGDLRDW